MNPGLTLLRSLAVAGMLLGSACTLADARVQVTAEAARLHVYAEIDTRVDRETAWGVLTDYNRWSEFVPDLLLCRVISRPGEPLRLEQRGRLPGLPNFPLVLITQVEESPPQAIRFQRLAGNVRALTGEWQILGTSPVRLIYRSMVEPGLPMPPQMTLEIFRNDAKLRLEAMAREMARRAGSAR